MNPCADLLLRVLNRLFPPERPSDTELINYGREQVLSELSAVRSLPPMTTTVYLYNRCPDCHIGVLERLSDGLFTCPHCARVSGIMPQVRPPVARPAAIVPPRPFLAYLTAERDTDAIGQVTRRHRRVHWREGERQ